MAQLRQYLDKLKKLDVEVLIIGPENSNSFRKYWKIECFPFIVLPDPDHSVMDLYGQEVKLQKLGRMPAHMLIDKTGILKFVYYVSSMADIPNLTQIEKIFSKSLQ